MVARCSRHLEGMSRVPEQRKRHVSCLCCVTQLLGKALADRTILRFATREAREAREALL
jgi:hypothetical protein